MGMISDEDARMIKLHSIARENINSSMPMMKEIMQILEILVDKYDKN